MPLIKNDTYKKARGGRSRLLDIFCADCDEHICLYQKDGPGILKRMYLDRISDSVYADQQNVTLAYIPQLICPQCKSHLGTPIIYKKESRLAYRLFVGSVSKKLNK